MPVIFAAVAAGAVTHEHVAAAFGRGARSPSGSERPRALHPVSGLAPVAAGDVGHHRRAGLDAAFRPFGPEPVFVETRRLTGAWVTGSGTARDDGLRAAVARGRSDAFIQQGVKLVGSPATKSYAGSSVALSDDGTIALVGAPGLTSSGGAFVFLRSGSGWSQQGPPLVGSGGPSSTSQGSEIALSADGSTALIAGSAGAYVFSRSGSTWTQQGSELVGASTGMPMNFSVALSADGNTALLGESGLDNWVGAVFVFIRSGSTWSQQGAPLVGDCTSSCTGPDGTGEAGAGLFGAGVALSGDGNTALIGAPGDGGPFPNAVGPGAAWVFTRSGSTWSQQGPKLVGSAATGSGSGQGAGVALSGDGSTALINGPNDGNGAGAAWIFTHTGPSWTQQAKLAGRDELYGNPVAEVALSDDGNSALIGGTNGAQLAVRSGSTWAAQQPSLTGTGAVGSAEQGSSVALAGNGATALIGGPFDNGGVGAAWAFAAGPSLTVALAGSGSGSVSGLGISCPGTCSEGVPAGSTITLIATPTTGSTFAGWSGGGCTGTGSCTVTLNSDQTVTAIFALSSPQPVLSALRISPSTFTLAGRRVKGRCARATRANRQHQRCTRPITLHISYTLNTPAHVTITIARQLPGRLVNHRCAKPTRTNHRHRRCTRLLTLRGALTYNGQQGANTFTLNGRIGGHKLHPGTHRLTATPTLSGHTGTPQTVKFTIRS